MILKGSASCLILLLTFVPLVQTNTRDLVLKKVLTAWDNYSKYPSTKNAEILAEAFPNKNVDFAIPLFKEILETESFRKLEINAFSGERNAIRAMFRMLTVSDGAAGEFLRIEIGLLLRVNPKVFLEELKTNRILIPDMDGFLTNYGPFWGDDKAEEYERSNRIKAIESVKDERLAEVKEECINELKKRANKFSSIKKKIND